MDDIDRQLWEIGENLLGAGFGPAELAQNLKRRKELWEQREAETGTSCPTLPTGRCNKGFAQDNRRRHVGESCRRSE